MAQIIEVKKINKFIDQEYLIKKNEFESVNLFKNSNIKKILIIKWGGMGDVIQASSVINDILNQVKKTKIDINTLPQWKCLFSKDKRINLVWGENFKTGLGKIISAFNWIKKVKSNNYDLIIDLQTNDKSRILLFLLKFFTLSPKYLIGNHFIFPYNVKCKSDRKILQPFTRLQRTISTIGLNPTSNKPKLIFEKNVPKFVQKIFLAYRIKQKKYVVFLPGSSKNNILKRWGVNNFVELSRLIQNNGSKVLILGGYDDIDVCNIIKKNNPLVINLCNKLKLPHLIYFFRGAQCIIANDTGPTHLAACCDTPLIQITGPTDPFNVKPFGENVISIQSDIPCKNCYKKFCEHHSCMLGIKPIYIYNLISKLL